ncbi:lysylphosphatidylglycerol synthetase-like protein (DUF2156 family) [Pseudarthrobacter sp. PvP004]|nr:lysylphosphatidylglycerol synthetase-like protein (DUF2156 family) [Pseudarthrobacter sp. PvP004]
MAASSGSLINGPSPALLSMVGIAATDPASSWWSLVTSAFFATSWLDYLIQIIVFVVGVGIAERIIGPWKALVAFLAGCVLSALVLTGLFLVGTSSTDEWVSYFSEDFVVGAYGGAAAALGAATASLNNLWRRRLRTWLLALAIMFALYVGVAQSLLLLVGALAGVLGGRMVGTGDGQTTKAGVFSCPRESRFLIATIVGVFAVGPFLAQLTSNFAMGPLSTVGALSLQNPPDPDEMRELCGGDSSCVGLQNTVGTNSAGAVLLSIIPLLLLLLCSEGLRRGRRLALWIALVLNVIFSAVVLIRLVAFLVSFGLENLSGIVLLYVLPAALVPAAIGALLFITRGRFRAGSGPEATRSMFQAVAIVTAAVIIVYTILWSAEGNLERGTIRDLLLQLTHVVIPFPMPFVVQLPRGIMTTLIYGFGGAVIWLAFAYLAFRNFRLFNRGGRGGDEQMGQVRTLLKRGGGSLSWMALWGNNRYWFSPDGQAGVAYQFHNGVALTVAGPFGVPEAQIEAARGFVAYCHELGLSPCFYSASSDLGASLDGMNFQALEVAEETLLNIENMSFNGKEWQNVRTALNRADKLGIKDQWHRYPTMPPRLRAQLAEISEEWMADKSLPEMGFTMGGLDELKDEDVLCCVAVDREGLVHGVTSWLPVFTEGHVTSWTLDFMRRRTTGFKGVMEFLIASAVTHFKTDVPTISLSGSPLADFGDPTRNSEEDAPAVVKILGIFRDALEPIYGFKSLAAFKSRFQPEYRSLYMYYQDTLALPSIGLAITAAYLPGLSAKQGTAIVRQMMANHLPSSVSNG